MSKKQPRMGKSLKEALDKKVRDQAMIAVMDHDLGGDMSDAFRYLLKPMIEIPEKKPKENKPVPPLVPIVVVAVMMEEMPIDNHGGHAWGFRSVVRHFGQGSNNARTYAEDDLSLVWRIEGEVYYQSWEYHQALGYAMNYVAQKFGAKRYELRVVGPMKSMESLYPYLHWDSLPVSAKSFTLNCSGIGDWPAFNNFAMKELGWKKHEVSDFVTNPPRFPVALLTTRTLDSAFVYAAKLLKVKGTAHLMTDQVASRLPGHPQSERDKYTYQEGGITDEKGIRQAVVLRRQWSVWRRELASGKVTLKEIEKIIEINNGIDDRETETDMLKELGSL